jgi:hypothetical protein
MRRSILSIAALLAIVAFAPSSQASPLVPAGGIATAVSETDMLAQAHYYGRRHWRHYGWWRGHHYGWRHRHRHWY